MAEALQSVKKHQIALFIKGTTDYFRIEKSTELSIAMNAETETRDFIADESPTEILTKYKPSIAQSLTMMKNSPDYEAIFGRFFNMQVGQEAVTDAMIVFKQEKEATPADTYKAWQGSASIVIDSLDAVAETITFNINFSGTMRKGTATITAGKPTFTEATAGVAVSEDDI